MTLIATVDADGDTLNLGDHVEIQHHISGQKDVGGEITQIFKIGKMRIKPDNDWQRSMICTPAEVSLLYRGDS